MAVCVFKPLAKNNKVSELYEDLLYRSDNNRSLSNFLYALSLQPEVMAQFDPATDFNSQQQLKIDPFVEKFGLQQLLSQNYDIKAESIKYGLTDRKGTPLYQSSPDDLISEVKSFNKDHKELKAVIKYSTKGYYAEVDTINADNYNSTRSLEIRENLHRLLYGWMNTHSLNTNFSNDIKDLFSIYNTFYFLQFINDRRKGILNISPRNCQLLLEMFETSSSDANTFAQRIIGAFGDDAAAAVAAVSGFGNRIEFTINEAQVKLIKNFLKATQKELDTIFNDDVVEKFNKDARVGVTEEEFLKVKNLKLRETLHELYKEFHLDVSATNLLQEKVKTLSEGAQKLFQIQLKRFEMQQEKTGKKDKSTQKRLAYLQAQLNRQEYLTSTIKMLQDIADDVESMNILAEEALNFDEIESNTPISVINELSGIVLRQIEFAECFIPVLTELQDADSLLNDVGEGQEDLINDIKDTAEELLTAVTKMQNNARDKQVDIVTAFLRVYWGEDSPEMAERRGTDLTLEQIIHSAQQDINFLDRWIYAANTTNDPMMNLLAEAVRRAKLERDEELKEKMSSIRSMTKELHDSGSQSSFMYERDDKGYPFKIVSDFDYKKFYTERAKKEEELKNDSSVKKSEIREKLEEWDRAHLTDWEFVGSINGEEVKLTLKVPIYKKATSLKSSLTTAQYNYWYQMMSLKAQEIKLVGTVNPSTLFDVIEIAGDVLNTMEDENQGIGTVYDRVKNNIKDIFVHREDDTDYGNLYTANGMALTKVDAQGRVLHTLPLFYTHKIKDRSRVSTDFSRSMLAYLSSSGQYRAMNTILDSLLLTKDYMLSVRRVNEQEGGQYLFDLHKLQNTFYANQAGKLGKETALGEFVDDFYEREIYSKTKKKGRVIWGIQCDKGLDALTSYNSITGLTVNALGGIANALVGKVQMVIEAGGAEFFNFKDLGWSDVKYFQLLPELLAETTSITKSSLLGKLMEKFDVLDDFYEQLQRTGFYKTPLGKIIGNTNLFFLYGMGEHLLHAQGMLACLHHIKVDGPEGKVSLFEAFDIVKDKNGEGTLIVKEGYTINGEPIDLKGDYFRVLKNRIAYVNKSMHGAFGAQDKGMIHRYAIGRMLMNFRQWMPAHYQRRFRGRHYDTDLGMMREGYYTTCAMFIYNCWQDLMHHRLDIAQNWQALKNDEMQYANFRRAMSEVILLSIITFSLWLLGPASDHKRNYAMRLFLYELHRMNLEVQASSPVALHGFIENLMKLLNSPFATLNTITKWGKLFMFSDIAEEVKSGPFKGENKYIRNIERALPFVSQIKNLLELDTNDDVFKLFRS